MVGLGTEEEENLEEEEEDTKLASST